MGMNAGAENLDRNRQESRQPGRQDRNDRHTMQQHPQRADRRRETERIGHVGRDQEAVRKHRGRKSEHRKAQQAPEAAKQ